MGASGSSDGAVTAGVAAGLPPHMTDLGSPSANVTAATVESENGKKPLLVQGLLLERTTGFEPATSTLARLRSTN